MFIEKIIKHLDIEDIIINKSNYNIFLNNAKVRKNKDLEDLYKKNLV